MDATLGTTTYDNASPGRPAASPFPVHVIATTLEGTRCALTAAKRLTRGLDARIVLLVPRLASAADTPDRTAAERVTIVDEHRALAADVGAHVTVLFCVCRRLDDVAHQMLGRSSLVIVGGRKHLWWPSREQRLVERLTREGYAVVLAETAAERRSGLATQRS